MNGRVDKVAAFASQPGGETGKASCSDHRALSSKVTRKYWMCCNQ